MSTFLILCQFCGTTIIRDTTTNNKPTVYGRDWPVSAHKTAHLQVRKRDVFVVQEQTCPRCGPAASCAAVHGPHSAAASSNTHCANDNRWSLLQRGENKGEAEGKIERKREREREKCKYQSLFGKIWGYGHFFPQNILLGNPHFEDATASQTNLQNKLKKYFCNCNTVRLIITYRKTNFYADDKC